MSFKDKETKRKSLLSGVSIVAAAAAALTATPAHAQDEEEAIVVTGSRIPQPNLVTTSPVTQVTGEDIQTQGVTRVEDLTNQLPQVFAAQGSNISNGASGTAQVNLRGIGAARTLVLIDGRRMGYGSPNSIPSDLNQIPGGLVERVEVLTGGASAVYGSDAIAGVVNFIMRDDFEGLRFDAQYGFFQHSNDYDDSGYIREELAFRESTNPAQFETPADDQDDGYGKEITITFGTSTGDGRGNVTGYLGYRQNDQVLQRDRDFSACALGAPSTAARPYSFSGQHWTCGGSGTAFPGTFTDFGLNSNPIVFFDPDGLDGIPGNADDPLPAAIAAAFAAHTTQTQSTSFNFTVSEATGEFIAFCNNLHQYNFGPTNFYQRPDERYTGGLFAHYEINDRIEAYGNFMFSDYRSVSQIAPSGDFFSTGSINCDNPLLTTDQQLLICGDGTVGYKLSGGVAVPDLGADNAVGGLNSPGAELFFGNDPDTPFNEALDDLYNTDRDSPCVDGDLIEPGMQCTAPLYIGRRNVEGGGRQDDLNFTSYRTVLGFRGPLAANWDYDIFGQYYRVAMQRSYLNDFSVTRLNRALDVIDADPGVGVDPQCRSAVDGTDPNCVPYNVFDPAGVTQDALDYLQIPLLQRGEATQQQVVGTITGEFDFGSPMA
jgi:outer membrane receptor protein involved in Fe transport